MQIRHHLTVVCAAIAASAASLVLALAPAMTALSEPMDGLRVVELPRVVISAKRDVRRVELPRVVVTARREAAPVAVAGSRSGAQPLMARQGL